MNRLGQAEEAFKKSLELEPGNQVAENEIRYIEHLKRGGFKTDISLTKTTSTDQSVCAICGQSFTEGVLVSSDGVPQVICKNCNSKKTKKWWQFWK